MSKRQRTTWRYYRTADKGSLIRIGWVHNPSYEPKEDVVRVQMINGNGRDYVHAYMTPLEALSLAAGIGLTVQHHLWEGAGSGKMPPLHIPRRRKR